MVTWRLQTVLFWERDKLKPNHKITDKKILETMKIY